MSSNIYKVTKSTTLSGVDLDVGDPLPFSTANGKQVMYTLRNTGTGDIVTFEASGGYGYFSTDPTWNIQIDSRSLTGSPYSKLATNEFEIVSGGITYVIVFSPNSTISPTIEVTAGTVAPNDLVIDIIAFNCL